MDQDSNSESDRKTFSAVNHIMASPEFAKRNEQEAQGDGQQRMNEGLSVPVRGSNKPMFHSRASRTPLMRTPQLGRVDRRSIVCSPLADLDSGNPLNVGFSDFNAQSPGSQRHRHRSANNYQDWGAIPLAVPIERGVGQIMFNGFTMIGPFRSSAKLITMQEHVESPAVERRAERVTYNLRKMNFFKPQQSVAQPRRERERDRDSFERPEPEAPPTPRAQRPRSRGRKIDKKSCKYRIRSPSSKQPKITCFCKKSSCKKEYCHCLKNKVPCNSKCGCSDCKNNTSSPENNNTGHRSLQQPLFPQGARLVPVQGHYRAVQPESNGSPQVQQAEGQLFRSCNCRKSFCQKKYCDCFSQGRRCTKNCHCDGCINK